MGINDFDKFSKDRTKYLKDVGKYNSYAKKSEELLSNYNINPQEIFSSFFAFSMSLRIWSSPIEPSVLKLPDKN
jgi:hypothetical protein